LTLICLLNGSESENGSAEEKGREVLETWIVHGVTLWCACLFSKQSSGAEKLCESERKQPFRRYAMRDWSISWHLLQAVKPNRRSWNVRQSFRASSLHITHYACDTGETKEGARRGGGRAKRNCIDPNAACAYVYDSKAARLTRGCSFHDDASIPCETGDPESL